MREKWNLTEKKKKKKASIMLDYNNEQMNTWERKSKFSLQESFVNW